MAPTVSSPSESVATTATASLAETATSSSASNASALKADFNGIVNPKPYLATMVGKTVEIRLKWNLTAYRGHLVSLDSYMNFQLADTEEFEDEVSTGKLGSVLIRCNNVLWIRLVDQDKSGANGA